METAARDRVNGRVQTAPLLYPLSQRFLSGTVGLRGTAHRGNRFLHPPADQSSSRMSGNLNRCDGANASDINGLSPQTTLKPPIEAKGLFPFLQTQGENTAVPTRQAVRG